MHELAITDLVVDAVYEGGRHGNTGDDPLNSMLGVSNQGGFRYLGSRDAPHLIVLTSNFNDPDWPDHLDRETGLLRYFGDNKKPGRLLHETPRFGNELLRNAFNACHSNCREAVPPFFLFRNTGTFRDIQFLGLAVPGAINLSSSEDLVAVWKSSDGDRFQNYKATFTILDSPEVKRAWINDIRSGNPFTLNAPAAWRHWRETGILSPLLADPTVEHRSRQQLPVDPDARSMVQCIRDHFSSWPVGFERCAAQLTRMMDSSFVSYELTRPSRDGGRDAIGEYRVGTAASFILIDFALEAKCYAEENSVGVREISRLISRLRHRQFGVLVTTSFVNSQAYKEVKEDQHPIVVIAATDIVEILKSSEVNTPQLVVDWLQSNFPAPANTSL